MKTHDEDDDRAQRFSEVMNEDGCDSLPCLDSSEVCVRRGKLQTKSTVGWRFVRKIILSEALTISVTT